MDTCFERPYDCLGRICKPTTLQREVRFSDPSITILPPHKSQAMILDIRGTSIVELPREARFLHLRTDYFVWSPRPRTFTTDITIPETVFSTMTGRRVGELFQHPILEQLGVHRRYFRKVSRTGDYTICSVVKRRPEI